MTRGPRGRLGQELGRMSEAEFQADLVEKLPLFGWHSMHVRKAKVRDDRHATPTSVAGWPDLELWCPTQRRRAHAELKSDIGRVSPDQHVVLEQLTLAGGEVYVWRPRDLEAIAAILRGPEPPADHPLRYQPRKQPR